MTNSRHFLTGVIEGFYGRSWSLPTRLAYAGYLADAGFNCYLYAPKGDPFLRRRWTEHWSAGEWRDLQRIADTCRSRGVQFGLGLSPVELYRQYGRAQRSQLRDKVARLAELGAPLLAILFDDMPGDLDALGSRQAEIVNDVCAWAAGSRVLVCPTYYSFDPVLEKYFGKMPTDYWPRLGSELPALVDIFWTGNRVCSESVVEADLRAIVEQLGRKVILWDNYPVNDGAERSNFLYTSKLSGRAAGLSGLLTGHLCNPMNQALLSLPALAGLAELYGARGFDEAALAGILGAETMHYLARDAGAFECEGLSGLGEARCSDLAREYAGLPGEAAREVAEWLSGEYRFDPACLTG